MLGDFIDFIPDLLLFFEFLFLLFFSGFCFSDGGFNLTCLIFSGRLFADGLLVEGDSMGDCGGREEGCGGDSLESGGGGPLGVGSEGGLVEEGLNTVPGVLVGGGGGAGEGS